MKKLFSEIDYGKDMDLECVDLCNAINALGGIITSESCCGHGKSNYSIWFVVDAWQDVRSSGLFFLTRCCDRRYWKYGSKWSIDLSVGDAMIHGLLPTTFHLHSIDVGKEAYDQAADLIDNLNYHLNHQNFMRCYNLKLENFRYIDV